MCSGQFARFGFVLASIHIHFGLIHRVVRFKVLLFSCINTTIMKARISSPNRVRIIVVVPIPKQQLTGHPQRDSRSLEKECHNAVGGCSCAPLSCAVTVCNFNFLVITWVPVPFFDQKVANMDGNRTAEGRANGFLLPPPSPPLSFGNHVPSIFCLKSPCSSWTKISPRGL